MQFVGSDASRNQIPFYLNVKIHEAMHGFQNLAAPCLHAIPANPRTNIVMTPEDFAIVREIMERDAHAKQGLLLNNIRRKFPSIDEPFTHANRYVAVKSKLHKKTSIEEILSQVSENIMREYLVHDNNGQPAPLLNPTHYDALSDYTDMLEMREENGHSIDDITFVRLELSDLQRITAGFGPNWMVSYSDEAHSFLGDISDKNRKKIEEINQRVGILERGALPTFSQLITGQNLDLAQFISDTMLRPQITKSSADILAYR